MKILITGSSGMLGQALCRALGSDWEVDGIDAKGPVSDRCDITDRAQLMRAVSRKRPGIIIHAAAYADVDGCQLNPDLAYKVNAEGTKNVAEAAAACSAIIFYISTDYVFDGRKSAPYTESDAPCPINVYGRTKLEGEKIISAQTKKNFIIRSSWLFGPGGKNFPDQIIELAKQKKQLKLVSDKYGCPTFTKDLAQALRRIMSCGDIERFFGTYHVANSGSCSWLDFAREALGIAGLNDIDIMPVLLDEFERPATVPKMSVLDCGKFQKVFAFGMRTWQEALAEHLKTTGVKNES